MSVDSWSHERYHQQIVKPCAPSTHSITCRCRFFFFFSSRRRHTRCSRDWSSDVCSSDLRDARGTFVPTFFVPLEDTRMQQKESAKLIEMTDLQWEFFYTCWKYNLHFWKG